MKTENKQKTVHYKKVDFLKGAKLSALLKQTLLDEDSVFHKAVNRQQFISSAKDDFLFINHVSSHQNMVFGELIVVESGKAQSILNLDEDATEYPIKSFVTDDLPQDKDDDESTNFKKEFVDSVLYFGVIDNHVSLIQTRALTAKTLESYLGWLLGEAAAVIPDNAALILKDAPNPKAKKKLDEVPAKKIEISSGIGCNVVQPIHKIENNSAAKIDYKIEDNVADILKAAIGLDIAKLNLQDDLDDANLKLKLTLTYNRRTSKSGQHVIDTVASSLRNSDDYVITLEDGTKLTADSFKLNGSIVVETINGKIYNQGLKVQLYNWMVDNIQFSEYVGYSNESISSFVPQ